MFVSESEKRMTFLYFRGRVQVCVCVCSDVSFVIKPRWVTDVDAHKLLTDKTNMGYLDKM